MSSIVDVEKILNVSVHHFIVWASWGSIFATVMIFLSVYSFLRAPGVLKLPIVLEDEIPSEKERIERYLTDTRNLLIHGYTKFKSQIFGISTTEGTNIVLPLQYLDDLKGHRALSFGAFLEEEFTLNAYTKLGNLTGAQIAIVNKELNPTLPRYIPVIQKLIRDHWPVGVFESQTPVKLYPYINELVSRVSARFFLGADAAKDQRWIDIATVYVQSAVVWTTNMKRWPKILRPIIHPFVAGRNQMVSQFNTGKEIVGETLRKKKANGNKPASDPPSLMDLLTSGRLTAAADDVEGQTIVQMNLCVAAIQSMAATVMQSLIDLSFYEEYIPELRAEVELAREESGGVLNKQALQKMLKLDSFLKETQRLNSPDLMGFQRKVQAPLTMSNGMKIPVGSRIVLPTGAINMDCKYFDNPEKFDGFRFYRKRMENEDSRTRHQLVTVGKTDLAWGYGRHACPGRFIAEVVMKLIMLEFLLRYDIKCPTTGIRPKNIEHEGVLAPDPEWELLLTSIRSYSIPL